MSRALIIRPSSLGDIVHALPIVHDIRRHRPDIAVDWVAEEAFAALLAMHRGVDRVIPVALRRWRHQVLDRATWREAAAFRRALTRDRYDLVLDLQEQVKGALLAWLARGPVHGPDRASIREPAASLQLPSPPPDRSGTASDRSLPAARRGRVRLPARRTAALRPGPAAAGRGA